MEKKKMKKMRLIDADALKANMFDYAPPEMVWNRGDVEHKINEMPTIDAIPVKWLREWQDEVGTLNEWWPIIERIITVWQVEQEAR